MLKTSLIELKIQHALGTITDDDVVGMFDEKRELLKEAFSGDCIHR